MPSPVLKRFTVEGSGEFPLDMLRSDRCWFAGADDAARIGAHYSMADPESVRTRSVTLETSEKYARTGSAGCRSGGALSTEPPTYSPASRQGTPMQIPRWLRLGRRGTTGHHHLAAPITGRADARVFRTLMFTAGEIAKVNPAALPDLIAAILRPEQSELVLGVAEHGQDAKKEVSGWDFFGPDFRDLFPEDRRRPTELLPTDYPLMLGRDPVLPCPWADSRFITAVAFIGSGKLDPDLAVRKRYGGRWRQDENHRVILWLPWRIGFVAGGNHSLAAGIVAGEGSLIPDRVEDFSCLFDLMECDGTVYRDRQTKKPIAPVADARHAAVFEIGRMIARSSGHRTSLAD